MFGSPDFLCDPVIMTGNITYIPIVGTILASTGFETLHPVNLGVKVAALLPVNPALSHIMRKPCFQLMGTASVAAPMRVPRSCICRCRERRTHEHNSEDNPLFHYASPSSNNQATECASIAGASLNGVFSYVQTGLKAPAKARSAVSTCGRKRGKEGGRVRAWPGAPARKVAKELPSTRLSDQRLR